MSAIPTVPVTIRFVDTQGQGIPGATVKAALTCQERYQGLDVPGQTAGLTDAQGEVVLALFPNELGSEGSAYALSLVDPYGGTFVRFVAIPNSPCDVELGAHVTTAVTGPQGQRGQKGEQGDKGEKGDKGDQGGNPGCYSRDTRLAAKAVSVAADRHTLLTPNRLLVDVGGLFCSLDAQIILDLSSPDAWDSTGTDYAMAAHRAGKDFYVYACKDCIFKILVSANATAPSGFTLATSRKIGGFHCLCVDVGVISGHPLSGYLAGDVLPASVWDLLHRPVCSPEGMVYVDGLGKWVDIYLASVSGGSLVSRYAATIANGLSSPPFHWYKFSQLFCSAGKYLPTQHEFVALSLGSNQGTNIASSTIPVTTGGHVDTAGRRMISAEGCEDCCGAIWQWGAEPGGGAASATWVNAYDANDSGVIGSSYSAPNRAMLGGHYNQGVVAGSRGSIWINSPLTIGGIAARGIAHGLEGL